MERRNPESSTELIVIGAESALRVRLGALFLPCAIRFVDYASAELTPGHSYLLSYPGAVQLPREKKRAVAFIGQGPDTSLSAAFEDGARDYLRQPWSDEEFRLRLERFLPMAELRLPGTDIVLRGVSLEGPRQDVTLSPVEARLLAELVRRNGTHLSRRSALCLLWPAAPEASRAVDMAITRIRRAIAQVDGSAHATQIRSVRGVGYIWGNTACG